MFEKPSRYRSYLLTIWEERSENPRTKSSWRFSLEDSRDGNKRGYSSLEALFEALKDEIKNSNRGDKDK